MRVSPGSTADFSDSALVELSAFFANSGPLRFITVPTAGAAHALPASSSNPVNSSGLVAIHLLGRFIFLRSAVIRAGRGFLVVLLFITLIRLAIRLRGAVGRAARGRASAGFYGGMEVRLAFDADAIDTTHVQAHGLRGPQLPPYREINAKLENRL
jgi:hypothetical protein